MNSTVFEPMDMTTAEALLKEAKEILDRLGLAFFLRHGTCLGAVRDQAFIPWDDDLDIGSVIGMHGLTEEIVEEAAIEFRNHGYSAEVIDSDLHMSVDLKKSGIQMDWTCYRIIDGNIYQWPVVKIPASLHENLKEIDFLGTKFMVPNPPEEYFRLKYGPDWMTPKQAGGFEQEILDLMAEGTDSDSDETSEILKLSTNRDAQSHTGSLKVVDSHGESVEGAEVTLAATTVLAGVDKARTDKDGFVYFSLPEEACYVVAVELDGRKEILYLEELEPGVGYLYQPDSDNPTGRTNALIANSQTDKRSNRQPIPPVQQTSANSGAIEITRVYVDMVADLFHYGHVNFLRQARLQGDFLLVGIHSDEAVMSYKRTPILSMAERIASVEGCRYVDEVVPNAPLEITSEWISQNKIDLIIHGDDVSPEVRDVWYGVPIEMGIYKSVGYTEGISTTELISRVKSAEIG